MCQQVSRNMRYQRGDERERLTLLLLELRRQEEATGALTLQVYREPGEGDAGDTQDPPHVFLVLGNLSLLKEHVRSLLNEEIDGVAEGPPRAARRPLCRRQPRERRCVR